MFFLLIVFRILGVLSVLLSLTMIISFSTFAKDTFSTFFKVGSLIAKNKLLVKEEGARFANSKELKTIFSDKNKGLLIDGQNRRISQKDSYEHVAVIAKPGSGKTTAFIIPNIFELSNSNCSMIVNDPSSEVYQLTSGHLQAQGYRVLKISPDDLDSSSRFNPFAGLDARHTIEIEQVCAAIIMSKYSTDKEQLWNDGAIENAYHIPRGMLEFWLDPESPYYKKEKFGDSSKSFILFCAGGMRSALAAKSLTEMGYENIAHVDGGFAEMKVAGFKVVDQIKK